MHLHRLHRSVVITRLHEARHEGLAKAKALLWALLAAFLFSVLSFFIPVLGNVPVSGHGCCAW